MIFFFCSCKPRIICTSHIVHWYKKPCDLWKAWCDDCNKLHHPCFSNNDLEQPPPAVEFFNLVDRNDLESLFHLENKHGHFILPKKNHFLNRCAILLTVVSNVTVFLQVGCFNSPKCMTWFHMGVVIAHLEKNGWNTFANSAVRQMTRCCYTQKMIECFTLQNSWTNETSLNLKTHLVSYFSINPEKNAMM